MHKKSKKLLSVLVAALMLFSTVGAYAFSFDEYDNAQGDAFVADYYANKDSYYKTDTGSGAGFRLMRSRISSTQMRRCRQRE